MLMSKSLNIDCCPSPSGRSVEHKFQCSHNHQVLSLDGSAGSERHWISKLRCIPWTGSRNVSAHPWLSYTKSEATAPFFAGSSITQYHVVSTYGWQQPIVPISLLQQYPQPDQQAADPPQWLYYRSACVWREVQSPLTVAYRSTGWMSRARWW